MAKVNELDSVAVSWCAEKSLNSLNHLGHAIEVLRKAKLDPELREALVAELGVAVADTSKMVAFFHGNADWHWKDPQDIMMSGLSGLSSVLERYKIEDPNRPKKATWAETKQALLGYLAGERAPNRTFIEECLLKCEHRVPEIEEMRIATDQLTLGGIDWARYVVRMHKLIAVMDKDFSGENFFVF